MAASAASSSLLVWASPADEVTAMPFVYIGPRLIYPSQLLQRLAAVEIARGVVRVVAEKFVEVIDGTAEIARTDVFHGQPVAAESVGRIPGNHRFEDFEAIHCCYYSVQLSVKIKAMPCPFFLPGASKGNFYEGRCGAELERLIPEEILRLCCNAGYARTRCTRAAEAKADAVNFLIARRARWRDRVGAGARSSSYRCRTRRCRPAQPRETPSLTHRLALRLITTRR